MEDKAFYMTGLEFGILLDSKGIRRCCCFDLKLTGELSEENLIRTLYDMTKRNWISVDEDGINVREEVDGLLESIKTASRIFQFSLREKTALVYLGTQMTVMDAVGNGQFRLRKLTYEGFIQWMEDEVLPELPVDVPESVEEWGNSRVLEEQEMLLGGELSACLNMAMIRILDISGSETGNRIYFLQGLLCGWVVSIMSDGIVENVSVDCRKVREWLWAQWKELGKR